MSNAPREVNLIAKDYAFLPDALDLVPGETVLLHVINGGLEVHEAVIGDAAVQDAWEPAEAATAGLRPADAGRQRPAGGRRPPGRRPLRPARRRGLDGARGSRPGRDAVGRRLPHPGPLAKGMQVPIRWVVAARSLKRPDGTLPLCVAA